jgi:uncharacterized protein YjbI with pentapeptide repeats
METRRNKNRYAREMGEPLLGGVHRLRGYIGVPGYFVHFSHYNKLGLNPTNKYNTPTGFYAYISNLRFAPFALDRPYAIVFRPTESARLLKIRSYTQTDLEADVRMLVEWTGKMSGFPSKSDVVEAFRWAEEEARSSTPGGRIWNITRVCASWLDSPNSAWTRILSKVLGYDGVVDECMSVIHNSEPCQAVFFNTSHHGRGANRFPKLELVEVIESFRGSRGREGGFRSILRNDKPALTKKDFVAGKEYRQVSFVGVDFSGMDMSGTRFNDCVFTGSKFVGANMRNVVMTMCIANHANMTRADLWNATIVDASLMGTVMKGASMEGANLSRSFIDKAKFDGAMMAGVDLSLASIRAVSFRSANLSGADFTSAEIEESDFTGTELDQAKFNHCHIDTASSDSIRREMSKRLGAEL